MTELEALVKYHSELKKRREKRHFRMKEVISEELIISRNAGKDNRQLRHPQTICQDKRDN